MDNRGNSIVEITIVLIVIVMIFGVVINSEELTTQKVSNMVENQNIETKLAEVIDYLINNPGENNWLEYKRIPGLAIVGEDGNAVPNSVSYSKFIALKDNYKDFVDEKIFKSKIKTSMELIPLESSISNVKIGFLKESDNVYSVNRLVKCDFYKKYVLKDFQNPGKCNHNHDNASHSCNYFKIFKGNLRKSDYYVVFDESEKNNAKYFFDTSSDKSYNSFKKIERNYVYLNDKIDFFNETSDIVFIHFNKKNVKAVLISVPKDFDKTKLKYDYFRTNNCELILRASYQ